MSSFTLDTDHGLISVTDTALKNDAPTLLLIHGNSLSSKVFRHIFESKAITSCWRVVAFDLPGHGSSSKSPNPENSYHMRGYADLAIHILHHLNIDSVVVFGWSLGGHIAIEMIDLLKAPEHQNIKILGAMLTGTAPALGKEQVAEAFRVSEDGGLGYAGMKDWTDEIALVFAQNSAAAGKPEYFESWMLADAKSTDGRARVMMMQRMVEVGNGAEGAVGADQRKVVESEDVLIAVVNGGDEQFINVDYVDGIRWKNLWRGKCMRLEGLHHAPFWEKPDLFEGILVDFMKDAEKVSVST